MLLSAVRNLEDIVRWDSTKRSCPSSGFYQLLDSLSSIDYDEDTPRKSTKLEIVDELPQGVYIVERLVAELKRVRQVEYVYIILEPKGISSTLGRICKTRCMLGSRGHHR